MKLNKNINYNRIEIWAPRYHDALRKGSYAVMVAPWKVGEHNIIYFTKARHLEGKEYYMAGTQLRSYPQDSNGKANMYVVPLNDLQLITDSSDDQWDQLQAEEDALREELKKKGIIDG